MFRRFAPLCALFLGIATVTFAAAPGTFLGTLVQAPDTEPSNQWIYVKGKNGLVRRVEISSAKITYADTVPKDQRADSPQHAMHPGAEVRVTAEQDSAGEWRADRVEIVNSTTEDPSDELPGDDAPKSGTPTALPEGANVA